MRIIARNQTTRKWEVVVSSQYQDEAELQRMLAESPSLIPTAEIRENAAELVVAVREVGLPGGGSADLVAFSAEGDIAIVECKLASNPEVKRNVIAQILEYGASLWGMTYDDLDRRVMSLAGQSLVDLVHNRIAEPEWSESAFIDGIRETLSTGAFMLVIAVDEINDELGRTIRFLNACGSPSFSFHALAMRRFTTEQFEVLVPHVHGPVVDDKPPSGRRRTWTEQEFIDAVKRDLPPEVAQAIEYLLSWSKAHADRTPPGTGTTTGSFRFHYLRDGKTIPVFSVYTTGLLTLSFGSLINYVSDDVLAEFHREITSIAGFANIPADFRKYPTVKIADVIAKNPDALTSFQKAVESLGTKI